MGNLFAGVFRRVIVLSCVSRSAKVQSIIREIQLLQNTDAPY